MLIHQLSKVCLHMRVSQAISGKTGHLEALPRQPAVEQEHEGVGKRLQVVSPTASAAQVSVYTSIPDGAPKVVRLLLILGVQASGRAPLGRCRSPYV